MRTWLRLLLIALVAGLGLALSVVALALPVDALINHATASQANPLPDISSQLSERSVVYAADGSVLATLHAAENRIPVSINIVPDTMINAVLDTEDSRFWTHGGVDLKSTVRALASDAKTGAVAQGGSTITQQLVKISNLTSQKHLDRKIKEAVIAMRLEQKYTKRQILEAYLNKVYFGNGAYGVQAAAEVYFNVDVRQVTSVQAAFIAGMIQDPLGYDPVLNPRDSKARRDFVLERMVTQGHLKSSEAAASKSMPIPVAITPPQHSAGTQDDYYVERVKQILLNQSTTLGDNYADRYNALFRGGLKIYTNLDPRMQDEAEVAITQTVPTNTRGFTASLASVDPTNGKVRALVGGPGFDTYKYDLAAQALRQPGSGFKVFTLLAALEAGIGPYSTIDGSGPCAVDFPIDRYHELLKTPMQNDEGDAAGPISFEAATANSVNCAFERVAAQVGLAKVVEMANRLGLPEKFDKFPSTVIGGDLGVTVLQMASAYATLAADGVYHQPAFIDHIDDRNGKAMYRAADTGKRVLDPQIARVAVQTLKAVVQYGTGVAANLYDRPVAGKTGTTENNSDAWFNGITPQLATSVWMGDPKGKTPMDYNHGLPIKVFGGTYPAKIWHTYTAAALQDQPATDFQAPDPNAIPPSKFIGDPSVFNTTTTVKRATTTTPTMPVTSGPPASTTPPVSKPVPSLPFPSIPWPRP